jgi:histidinol phosphatase-like enzyme (inositol monophosphatase family)
MDDVESRIIFALDWIKSVKKPILEVFYSLKVFDLKSNNTEVTDADRNTEKAFRNIVKAKFPRDGIIGEEFSQDNREGDEFTWTIDPIDGTRAFVRGVPFFGTMLSLYRGTDILFGTIAYHALGEIIYAVKNKGCYWKSDYLSEFVRTQVSDTSQLKHAVLSCSGEDYFYQQNKVEYWEKLKARVYFSRTWGDCFGYSLLARGKIDIMTDPILHQWDLVPIKIIVEEAGGLFLNLDGSETTIHSTSALCANRSLMPQILGE